MVGVGCGQVVAVGVWCFVVRGAGERPGRSRGERGLKCVGQKAVTLKNRMQGQHSKKGEAWMARGGDNKTQLRKKKHNDAQPPQNCLQRSKQGLQGGVGKCTLRGGVGRDASECGQGTVRELEAAEGGACSDIRNRGVRSGAGEGTATGFYA